MNLHRTTFIIFILLVINVLTGCEGKKKSLDNEDLKTESTEEVYTFSDYIEEKSNDEVDFSKDNIFLVLPDDACTGLVEALTPYINTIPSDKPFYTVLVGRSQKKLWHLAQKFDKREMIILDFQGEAYQKGIIKAMTPALYFNSSNEEQIIDYSEINLQKMVRDIDSLLSKFQVSNKL